MGTPEKIDRLVPFIVHIEGYVNAERIPQLVEQLGGISTSQVAVNIYVGEIEQELQVETVNKADFRKHWGSGAGICWGYLERLARGDESFPLQPSENSPGLHGSLDSAITWLEESGAGRLNATNILRRIKESRNEESA